MQTWLLARKALLNDEDYAKGYEYTKKMQGYYSESYLPLGDLTIQQIFKDSVLVAYARRLDISTATASTVFVKDNTAFERDVIASAPD